MKKNKLNILIFIVGILIIIVLCFTSWNKFPYALYICILIATYIQKILFKIIKHEKVKRFSNDND